MELRKIQHPGVLEFRLSGRLDAHQVARLKTEFAAVHQPLTLDVAGVTFIDSSGLALLVSVYKRAREAQLPLEIVRVPDTVRLILEMTGLNTVLPLQAAPAP